MLLTSYVRRSITTGRPTSYLCFTIYYSRFTIHGSFRLTPAQDRDPLRFTHTCVSMEIYDAEFFFVLLVSNEKIIPATQSTPPKMYAC
jgi:hypothetical protein